jgi:hypothetical protein
MLRFCVFSLHYFLDAKKFIYTPTPSINSKKQPATIAPTMINTPF